MFLAGNWLFPVGRLVSLSFKILKTMQADKYSAREKKPLYFFTEICIESIKL